MNRGLLGVGSILYEVASVLYEIYEVFEACEDSVSDSLCAGTVSKRNSRITGHVCIKQIYD